jgi:type IV pilus assembly protein PilY1
MVVVMMATNAIRKGSGFASLICAACLFGNTSTFAAPGTLADSPLFLSNAVEPNVLFLLDDSGSMDWGLMTDEYEGAMFFGCAYYYTHPSPDNTDFWVVPTEAGLDAQGIAPPYSGVWRAWNHNYNRLYYNPAVTYSPWPGKDANGNPYVDVDPAAAPYNPYSPAVGTEDLTTVSPYSTDFCTGGLVSFPINDFFPARYYLWKDSDLDDVVDPEDAHVLVEIKPGPVYPRDPNRTDCAAALTCSYDEEIQNFANWFSYHRKREHVAKAVYGQVIADSNEIRMGLVTVNNNGVVNTPVTSMNEDPLTGDKGTLLKALYEMQGDLDTPLRSALDNSGKYLSCQANGLFGSCPALPEGSGGECQQNFAVVMTDGYYNGIFGASYGNADGNNDTTWDSDTSGPFGDAYGGGDTGPTLADIAMHYYETDIRPGVPNEVSPPPGGVDENPAQHMVTYSIAFGVEGNLSAMPANTEDPFAWPDPLSDSAKIDDLRHAGWNGRGDFFSAQEPDQLASSLRGAVRSVQGRTSSASTVAFNTGSLSTNSEVYLALFNSQRWSGDLLSFDLNPLTGAVKTTANWSAGSRLATRNLSTAPRTILSYDGADGIAFQWASLTAAQKADFQTNPSGGTDNEATGMARHGFLRGDRGCELSSTESCSYDDGVNTYTSKSLRERDGRLGDIVHSGPIYVGVPESNWPDVAPFPGTAGDTYTEYREAKANRPGVVYVGSNDGMLHGFTRDTGNEILAYVPNSLVSSNVTEGLHYLSDPAYVHRYGVDLGASIADVYAKSRPAGSVSWKTVLVGGLRGGGRGLFALDVTDPGAFSETGSAPANTVMWEFTSADDIDLGHTFSKPAIVPLDGGSGSIVWAVIFGNGYNDGGSGEAKLFVLRLEGGLDGVWTLGTDYIEITTGVGTTADRNGLSTPAVVDTDADGLADRVYAGDLKGNMWAFDLSGSNPGNWGVAHKSGGSPLPLFSSPANQQISTAPIIVRNSAIPISGSNTPNLMVLFGTGQYLTTADITSTDTQSMYGVWDSGDGDLDQGDLVEQKIGLGTTASGDTVRTLTSNTINYKNENGWYMDLPDTGERLITDPSVRGELVFFNTMVPDPDPCNFGGRSWLMVADWIDGSAPDAVSFDVNRDSLLNDDDKVNGKAAAGLEVSGISTSPVNLGNKRYTSTTQTTGASSIEVSELADVTGPKTGRMSWEELTP